MTVVGTTITTADQLYAGTGIAKFVIQNLSAADVTKVARIVVKRLADGGQISALERTVAGGHDVEFSEPRGFVYVGVYGDSGKLPDIQFAVTQEDAPHFQ